MARKSNDNGTFGGIHRPVPRDGRARSAREAQDRASFDNSPVTGGCAAMLFMLLTVLGALLAAVLG